MHFDQILIQQVNSDLSKARVLVVGDVMLDRYWFGDVNRISPEAPVPIAKINKVENRPGGAANVARNIASLGGSATLLSVVGNDEPAHTLENLLKEDSVKVIFKKDATINTIVKLRVMARNQQLLRLDFEEKPSHEILAEVLDSYIETIKQHDVVILSDYAKGGLTHMTRMIEIAREYNKPILVDPKGTDYLKYKNATLITPNKNELKDAIGEWSNEEDLTSKTLALKNELGLEYLLLTRSEEGMSLYSNEHVDNYPTCAREVYDVSGAGDTVIATMGLMLANNATIQQATLLANLAAGIVVAKVGTATVSREELLDKVYEYSLKN